MVKKAITFIYSDAVEKQVDEMIAAEAEKRGYDVRLTNDPFAKCEIGWYCQHINFPQNSRFSVIMLHDITQQYGYWPDIWLREPWNKYDIGFLPSLIWKDNWDQCSGYFYSRPKKGMYLTGWPKADRLSAYTSESKRKELAESFGLDPSKRTVVYAPAWENDGKQDEFVQAMLKTDVNILIKQAPWPETYPDQIKNVAEMRELHKDIKRVIQLDPRTNILDAIMVSDILVSEESSTMCESVMLGKPAVSVSNWLIPEGDTKRYPSDEYDFVVKTLKENLTECVAEILSNYDIYEEEAKAYSASHFSNIGSCIPMMLDILDATINGAPVPYGALVPAPKKKVPFRTYIYHVREQFHREVYYNYRARSVVVRFIWNTLKRIKDLK